MATSASGSLPKASSNQRPTGALINTQSTSDAITVAQGAQGEQSTDGKKRRNHRAGKKKNRRQSFVLPRDEAGNGDVMRSSQNLHDLPSTARPPLYRLGQSGGMNLSETSLDSEALLDHR